MLHQISNQLVMAFSLCPRKAKLLLSAPLTSDFYDYNQMILELREINRSLHLKSSDFLKKHTGIVDTEFTFGDFRATCDIWCTSHARSIQYPLLFTGSWKAEKNQKIELAYIGFVYSLAFGVTPQYGILIARSGKSFKIRLAQYYKEVKQITEQLTKLTPDNTNLPPIMWSRHCPICDFRNQCRPIAEKEGSLWLLSHMTAKLITKNSRMGVFTLEQLSYQYRPRRRKKKRNPKATIPYQAALQALALREKKVLVQVPPEPMQSDNYFILDIEGDPGTAKYYLLGLLFVQKNDNHYHSFWADNENDQKKMWLSFLGKAKTQPQIPIYHYGSFDLKAIRSLSQRYGGGVDIIERMVNINTIIYGRIYFPTYSNSLKEIGAFLGAAWTYPEVTGLQALVWRYRWEKTKDDQYKQLLLTYNHEDCNALLSLISFLCTITSTHIGRDVDILDRQSAKTAETGAEAHRIFETIIKSAHADYQGHKITLEKKTGRTQNDGILFEEKKIVRQRIYNSKPNRIIKVPSRRKCPRCKAVIRSTATKPASISITDLKFTIQGCRKIVTKYMGCKVRCLQCARYYNPRIIAELGKGRKYGEGLMAWGVHQRIVCRLPYRTIEQVAEEVFNIHVSDGALNRFVTIFACRHQQTEKKLQERLLESPFIHVDETQINIHGINQYVWIFTDGRYVIFRITETRETDIVHKILSDYSGTLITDFYGGYDSVKCKQQKCLSHLIRDINDDLWKEPFNQELESFVLRLSDLFKPIFIDLYRYGSKKRHLLKHVPSVDRFYRKSIENNDYQSESVIKFQKRFKRYRDCLFRFLCEDGIPWNNNTAERGIRHIAVQRKISGSFGEQTISQYLRLLGIAQSCRFQEKSFLKFLLSDIKNLDEYHEPKKRFRKTEIEKKAKQLDGN
jgi:predicted RecB family nuclease